MKAITLGEFGVKLSEIDLPSPKSSQVLVKVRACGMNRSDLLETQGQSFGHLSGDTKVLGGEFAGEVVEVGSEVKGLVVGDKVMCRGGSGWAEYAVANWRRAEPMGDADISWEQAACVQGALQTGPLAGAKPHRFVKRLSDPTHAADLWHLLRSAREVEGWSEKQRLAVDEWLAALEKWRE